MIYIAHRALFNGPDQEKENTISQIEIALFAGFDCEIDIRWIDGKWFLGHDNPDYEVPEEFLLSHAHRLWLHCKNLGAMVAMNNLMVENVFSYRSPNFFWHQEDAFALTSDNYIWSYPGKPVASENGILVLPETDPDWRYHPIPECAGICSKYVEELRTKYG